MRCGSGGNMLTTASAKEDVEGLRGDARRKVRVVVGSVVSGG